MPEGVLSVMDADLSVDRYEALASLVKVSGFQTCQ
jgi:hypothetical protein